MCSHALITNATSESFQNITRTPDVKQMKKFTDCYKKNLLFLKKSFKPKNLNESRDLEYLQRFLYIFKNSHAEEGQGPWSSKQQNCQKRPADGRNRCTC
jgi:hypothetical protein